MGILVLEGALERLYTDRQKLQELVTRRPSCQLFCYSQNSSSGQKEYLRLVDYTLTDAELQSLWEAECPDSRARVADKHPFIPFESVSEGLRKALDAAPVWHGNSAMAFGVDANGKRYGANLHKDVVTIAEINSSDRLTEEPAGIEWQPHLNPPTIARHQWSQEEYLGCQRCHAVRPRREWEASEDCPECHGWGGEAAAWSHIRERHPEYPEIPERIEMADQPPDIKAGDPKRYGW